MPKIQIDPSTLPYEKPVYLRDARIPEWVRAEIANFPDATAVARCKTPEGEEWWLLDDSGDLIESLWQAA